MAESTLLGLNGEPNVYECAYVATNVSGGRGCVGAQFVRVCECMRNRGLVESVPISPPT